VANNKINHVKNTPRLMVDGHFDCHGDAACGSMIQGTLSEGAHPGLHWKPLGLLSGECLRHIAPISRHDINGSEKNT
jgi:hypothetical protein